MSSESNIDQIKPYLTLFGENVYLQAAGILITAYIIGKLINLFLGTILHRFASKSQSRLDDQIIRFLRAPVFYSIIIIATVIAAKLIFPVSVEVVVVAIFETVAVILWTVLTMRLSRLLIRVSSEQKNKFTLIHSQTLPLFELVYQFSHSFFLKWGYFNIWFKSRPPRFLRLSKFRDFFRFIFLTNL